MEINMDMYESIVKNLTKETIKSSLPIFKDIKDSVSHFMNDGFLDYFSNSLDKYKKIKTLLHRQPTNFYDIYFPTKLSYGSEVVSTDSVTELFSKNNFITIIGDAGSGKSTLIKHLFISTLIESFKAPIFIALRDLNLEEADLEIYLRKIILENKLSPSDKHLNKLLDNGDFLFFLDGYDEIKSSDKHEITKKLEKFVDKYPNNKYVLTSRPYSNIEYFKSFHNYSIADLNREDRVEFIKQQIKDTKLSEKIIESISEARDGYINSFLKNPLLLTLYIITYSKNSSIPKNKYIFYRRVFDVLYAEHDSATKIGYEREIKTQLSQEVLEKILQLFCFLSFFDNHFDFDKNYVNDKLNIIKTKDEEVKFRNNDFIEDMKLSIGLWVEDSGIFSFAHRSLQEYFAAVYVTNISNIDNKEIVYKKIVTLACKENFDMNNFLSLCYEMDYQFFIKYYTLHILEKVRALFIDKFNNLNYEFPYINDGFFVNESVAVTNELRLFLEVCYLPNIYFEEYLWRDVLNLFLKNTHNNNFDRYILSEGEFRVYWLPKKENITSEYIEFLKEIGMDKLLLKIVKEIDEIIVSLESDLESKKNIEDDFITMI
jgi:energy-coupling factor transporter ATP-binding protein EcfA2